MSGYPPKRPAAAASVVLRLYMVQDLSWESWGAGGCGAGLDLGTTKGLGLKAGGLSCTPMRGATTGLKVLMVSLVELVLRRMGGSVWAVDLSMTPWMGLRESPELGGVGPPPLPPPELWRCSSVSSTTSGACLAELWRSSSRNSFRAVFMVSSMSWRRWGEKWDSVLMTRAGSKRRDRGVAAHLCDGLWIQGFPAVVAVHIGEARILARRRGAADWGALHFLEGLVAADVVEATVASAAPAFRAVCRHVVVRTAHVPGAEVADEWRAELRGACMASVPMLGGMHHAVDLAGAGGGASRGWVGSFLMPAESKEGGREGLMT